MKVYETADSRSTRATVVTGLASRNEPESTDRLIEIARTGTDAEVRRAAIRCLGEAPRRNDPKVQKALAEILSGGEH